MQGIECYSKPGKGREKERERESARARERERETLHSTHTCSKRSMSEAKTKQPACEELVPSGTALTTPTIGRTFNSGGGRSNFQPLRCSCPRDAGQRGGVGP